MVVYFHNYCKRRSSKNRKRKQRKPNKALYQKGPGRRHFAAGQVYQVFLQKNVGIRQKEKSPKITKKARGGSRTN